MRFRRLAALAVASLAVSAAPVGADWTSPGAHRIALRTSDGGALPIGDLIVARAAVGITYRIALDPMRFKGYFLSMREFKCVAGADIQCHVPYPYPHPRTATADDLRWLEHDLLFLSKSPSEFGAYLRNGIYYKLSVVDGGLVGAPEDIDLDAIAAPPDDADVPPYGAAERQPTVRARWITGITIARDPQ